MVNSRLMVCKEIFFQFFILINEQFPLSSPLLIIMLVQQSALLIENFFLRGKRSSASGAGRARPPGAHLRPPLHHPGHAKSQGQLQVLPRPGESNGFISGISTNHGASINHNNNNNKRRLSINHTSAWGRPARGTVGSGAALAGVGPLLQFDRTVSSIAIVVVVGPACGSPWM